MRVLVFILLSGCTHIVKIDSSFVEGCIGGAYVAIFQLRKQPVPYKVQAMCMDMYLKRLNILNPQYKFIPSKEKAI